MSIHPSAIIDPSAEIAEGVEIGPFSLIGPHVKIGPGCEIGSSVTITGHTEIGSGCRIFQGASIGMPPQDIKFKKEDVTYVKIGDNNIIREFVTVHSATGAGNVTRIGNGNFLMAYVHVGHNCELGSNIIVSNASSFAGHVRIDDNAVVGGMTGVHQFVRIGCFTMVGGCSRINIDAPPFSMVAGSPERFYGLNVVGLRRHGMDSAARLALKRAYSLLCSKTRPEAIAEIEAMEQTPEIVKVLEFVKAPSKRGICFRRERVRNSEKDVTL